MYHQGEFLIVKADAESKKCLCVRVRENGKTPRATIEGSKLEDKRDEITIDPELVVAVLGPKPPYGRAYGALVEPYRGLEDDELWGPVHFYRKLNNEERKALRLALKKAGKWLVAHKIDGFLPITIEVRHKQGRYSGTYKVSPKLETDLMTLKPEGFVYQELPSLLIHEAFHGVWFQLVPDALKVRWINLYTYYIKLSTADTQSIERIRRKLEIAHGIEECRLRLKERSREDDPLSPLALLDECLAYIDEHYNLDEKHVDMLLHAHKSLKPYWPRHAIDLSKANPIITEYAMTKVEEFFAEAGRVFYEGKAPKRVRKLMKRTIRRVAGKRATRKDDDDEKSG